MDLLFVHPIFPAQFGPALGRLSGRRGLRCTFISEASPDGDSSTAFIPRPERVRRLQYPPIAERAADLSSAFRTALRRALAVYETMKRHPRIDPDVIVGHSGFGSTLFLKRLYDRPIINYFEYYGHARNSALDFRPEFPPTEDLILGQAARNAVMLLDLEACAAGYSPTRWQRGLFPKVYRHKIRTIFDGVDVDFWRRRRVPRRIGRRTIGSGTRIVTYVSRGFESFRGFDRFMKVAKRIADVRDNVIFVCVGANRVWYGPDSRHIRQRSFGAHVIAQDQYDASRFIFTGPVAPIELVNILSMSDLHIYFTVPYVLSWSLMNALACGCTVLASDTAPVREMIRHNRNGLLAGFYDTDTMTRQALAVLDDPEAFGPLGEAATALIHERYSVDKTLPKLLELFHSVHRSHRAG